MKKIFYYISLLILVSCYTDDEVSTVQSENNAHRNSEFTRLVKAISLHDASFDNSIDNTSCFSLNFPYQIRVNSNLRTINSVQDISDINSDDDVDIVYPVNVIFYNYKEHDVTSETDFNLMLNSCNQDFDIQPNYCLDIQYPITFKEYNDLIQSFETFRLNSDKEVFLHLEDLHDNDIFEIDYPIYLSDTDSNIIRVDSNADFITVYNQSIQSCQ